MVWLSLFSDLVVFCVGLYDLYSWYLAVDNSSTRLILHAFQLAVILVEFLVGWLPSLTRTGNC